jgi:hypothetical protein
MVRLSESNSGRKPSCSRGLYRFGERDTGGLPPCTKLKRSKIERHKAGSARLLMDARTPEALHPLWVHAHNLGDLDSMMALCEPEVCFVTWSGHRYWRRCGLVVARTYVWCNSALAG